MALGLGGVLILIPAKDKVTLSLAGQYDKANRAGVGCFVGLGYLMQVVEKELDWMVGRSLGWDHERRPAQGKSGVADFR